MCSLQYWCNLNRIVKLAFYLLIAILAWCPSAFAQQTIVQATVLDPRGFAYQGGGGTFTIQCPGNNQPYVNRTPIPRSIPINTLDGAGHFQQTVYDTSFTTDVNSAPLVCQWKIAVNDQCQAAFFTTLLTGITGSGPVNLSAQINAAAVNLSPACTPPATVQSFSAGNLPPLFTTLVTNPTTNPNLSFTLSSAAANTVFGNCTGVLAPPNFCTITNAMLPANSTFNILWVDGTTGGGHFATLASALAACTVNCWIINTFPEAFASNPFTGFTALAKIDVGAGLWTTNAQIIIPAGVSYFTGSGRAFTGNTVIRAGGSMPINTPIIKALGGQGQVLSKFVIDCNSTTGSTGILATDWNENSGIEKMLVLNCPNRGVDVDASLFSVQPAQNYFIRDLEVFPQAAGSGTTIGLHLKGNGGGGPGDVTNVTANGASGHVIQASVLPENWNIGKLTNLHGEFATHVFQVPATGISGFILDQVSGSPTDTDVVNISGASTTNAFTIRNISTSGAAIPSIVDPLRLSAPLTDQVLSEYKIGAGTLATQEIYSTSLNIAKRFSSGAAWPQSQKAVNYTLLATDSIVDFTVGTSTITVPHAVKGQLWMVRNDQASAAITMSCDSGLINGAASVPLQQLTGATVWADGTNCFESGGSTSTIASGTAALGTAAIASGACAAAVTVAAPGVLTTDVIHWSFNSDPGAITGYSSLVVHPYPISGNVDFRVCNPSAGSVTPSAATLNWRVTR